MVISYCKVSLLPRYQGIWNFPFDFLSFEVIVCLSGNRKHINSPEKRGIKLTAKHAQDLSPQLQDRGHGIRQQPREVTAETLMVS
jgi:hypothetical protein